MTRPRSDRSRAGSLRWRAAGPGPARQLRRLRGGGNGPVPELRPRPADHASDSLPVSRSACPPRCRCLWPRWSGARLSQALCRVASAPAQVLRASGALRRPLAEAMAARWRAAGAGGELLVPVPVHAERAGGAATTRRSCWRPASRTASAFRGCRPWSGPAPTTPQFELGRHARRSNVSGAFALRPGRARFVTGRWIDPGRRRADHRLDPGRLCRGSVRGRSGRRLGSHRGARAMNYSEWRRPRDRGPAPILAGWPPTRKRARRVCGGQP